VAAGNADDAHTHKGMPQLRSAIPVLIEVAIFLENLPLSYLGNNPGLYLFRSYYRDQLFSLHNFALGIADQADGAIYGLTLARIYFERRAAWESAADAVQEALSLLRDQCGCQGGSGKSLQAPLSA